MSPPFLISVTLANATLTLQDKFSFASHVAISQLLLYYMVWMFYCLDHINRVQQVRGKRSSQFFYLLTHCARSNKYQRAITITQGFMI
jgi:hypothetical protein